MTIVNVRVRLTDIHRREWVLVGITTIALLLALFAQRTIYNTEEWTNGALFYFVAIVLLIGVWVREGAASALPLTPIESARPVTHIKSARRLLVIPSLIFALLAFLTLGENEFTVTGTFAWLTSLALFFVALWDGTPALWWASLKRYAATWTKLNTRPLRISWTTIIFVLIFAVGSFFYFFRLDAVPAEMTSDHAEKIYDTYDILQGKRPIFFERNTGREPLQFYMNAAVVALGITPLEHIALKTVTALMGLLTVPGVYLLAREMFDEEVGLLSAFFTAVSIWPVAIARVGLRYPLNPVFVAFSMFFLIRALRKQSRNDFLMAGLMLGIGLNGYSPFRVTVLVAIAFLLLWLFVGRNVTRDQLPRYILNAGIMFGAMGLVFLPLMRYILYKPEMFFMRTLTRVTSDEVTIPGNPILIFLDNVWRGILMFNVRGDVVWVNSIPNLPIVDYITGALIFIGAIYATYRIIRYREYPYLFIFVGIFILLLPSTLSIAFPEENPSVVRGGGAIPFVMILAALPLALWYRQMRRVGSRGLSLLLMGLLLLWTIKINYDLYFIAYDEEYRRASWNTTEVAAAFKSFALTQGDLDHAYIIVYPYWVDHRAVGIHVGRMQYDSQLITNPDTIRDQVHDNAPKLYALNKDDTASINLLRELYPSGVLKEYISRTPFREFKLFYAPPSRSG